MKIKIGISSIVMAALCGAIPAVAQQEMPNHRAMTDEHAREHLGPMEKANDIIGMEVKDSQGEKVGRVKDLAIDLQNGRVVEVVVGTGGTLGMDEHFMAIPPGEFAADATGKGLELKVEKARYTGAPSFKDANWEGHVQPADVAEVYRYYGTRPYFTSEEQAAGTPGRLGDVQRAGKVMGERVRNAQDEKIGKVENLMVDLPAGRIVEVIVASGGFLGLGDEMSAIPPQSFHQGSEADTLVLDATKESLASAPHFKSAEWSEMNNPEQAGLVYQSYKVAPYFTTNAVDNTRKNVRDRAEDALTPLKQGSSPADVETTRQIRRQIVAADGLSVNARNVKIITIDGHVTLRGPVDSEEEKREIAGIAANVATAGNVDNQLEVAAASSVR